MMQSRGRLAAWTPEGEKEMFTGNLQINCTNMLTRSKIMTLLSQPNQCSTVNQKDSCLPGRSEEGEV